MVLSQDSVSHGEIDAAPNLPEVPPPVHTLLGDQSDGTNEAEPHRNIQRDTTPFKEVGVPDQDPIQHASGSNIVTEDLGFHPSGTQASAMLSQSKASGSSHGSLDMYTHLSSKSKGKWKEGAQPSNSDLIATPASTHIQGARRKKVVVEEYVEEEDLLPNWVHHTSKLLQEFADRQIDLPLYERVSLTLDHPSQFVLGGFQLLANREKQGAESIEPTRRLPPQLLDGFVDIERWAKEYLRTQFEQVRVGDLVTTLLTIISNSFYEAHTRLMDSITMKALASKSKRGGSCLEVADFAFGFDFHMSQELPFLTNINHKVNHRVRNTFEPEALLPQTLMPQALSSAFGTTNPNRPTVKIKPRKPPVTKPPAASKPLAVKPPTRPTAKPPARPAHAAPPNPPIAKPMPARMPRSEKSSVDPTPVVSSDPLASPKPAAVEPLVGSSNPPPAEPPASLVPAAPIPAYAPEPLGATKPPAGPKSRKAESQKFEPRRSRRPIQPSIKAQRNLQANAEEAREKATLAETKTKNDIGSPEDAPRPSAPPAGPIQRKAKRRRVSKPDGPDPSISSGVLSSPNPDLSASSSLVLPPPNQPLAGGSSTSMLIPQGIPGRKASSTAPLQRQTRMPKSSNTTASSELTSTDALLDAASPFNFNFTYPSRADTAEILSLNTLVDYDSDTTVLSIPTERNSKKGPPAVPLTTGTQCLAWPAPHNQQLGTSSIPLPSALFPAPHAVLPSPVCHTIRIPPRAQPLTLSMVNSSVKEAQGFTWAPQPALQNSISYINRMVASVQPSSPSLIVSPHKSPVAVSSLPQVASTPSLGPDL